MRYKQTEGSAQVMAAARRRRPRQDRLPPSPQRAPAAPGLRVFSIPLALTAALLLASLLWQTGLVLRLRTRRANRAFHVVLRPQHYLQATLHISVFAYWGYFWGPVYDHVWLLVGQLLFAYAFDMLLSWSRRERYGLGFGPFPIIFSTNLFLWFRDDWFYLQFLMIAVGFLGKEFSLWLFSLILIATGTSDLTWGQDIASTLTLAPQIYLFLFLIGLVAMYAFSITLVAGSAAIVLFGLSALYSPLTGVPYFIDSEIPSAVFLGLHLLVTDPSTSPRTPVGKTLFGAGYGLGVFGLYSLLGAIGVPTFYDKLLCVPLLNLSVPWIDRLARTIKDRNLLARWTPDWTPTRANVVHMTVWGLFFGVMAGIGSTDSRHRGDAVPFWQQVCAEDRPQACSRLIQLETNYCNDNAGWACNELGGHYTAGVITPADQSLALTYFAQACELRFQAGCVNLLDPTPLSRAAPRPLDLRLLLREAGPNLLDMPEAELFDRACAHGWSFACRP